ncbi:major allergen I polypeptide chain 1-like [Mesocricetus auratus]|uniref:Major allergen I polypeptide chain 1-like n=1 Tax=Mesocricetus auratus TaxID=10036 RepID=A0ABM2WQ87_MESAU|nr:major allergen I polypeptide chain 1-like [Mesocricetus auratus]
MLIFKGGSPTLYVPDCGICQAIKEKVELFLGPSVDDYVNFVKKYKDDSATLENAENLKNCADNNLREEDKESVHSLLAKIDADKYC